VLVEEITEIRTLSAIATTKEYFKAATAIGKLDAVNEARHGIIGREAPTDHFLKE